MVFKAAPVDTRVPDVVRRVLIDTLGPDQTVISPQTPLASLGLVDELDVVDLVIALEDAYGLWPDHIRDTEEVETTWMAGTVQTVIETLIAAGVKL